MPVQGERAALRPARSPGDQEAGGGRQGQPGAQPAGREGLSHTIQSRDARRPRREAWDPPRLQCWQLLRSLGCLPGARGGARTQRLWWTGLPPPSGPGKGSSSSRLREAASGDPERLVPGAEVDSLALSHRAPWHRSQRPRGHERCRKSSPHPPAVSAWSPRRDGPPERGRAAGKTPRPLAAASRAPGSEGNRAPPLAVGRGLQPSRSAHLETGSQWGRCAAEFPALRVPLWVASLWTLYEHHPHLTGWEPPSGN